MADLTQIFAANGPLPLKTSVDIQSNMPAVVTLAGSVWANTSNQQIGIALLIDGEVAASATIFANPASQHMAVVPVETSATVDVERDRRELSAHDPDGLESDAALVRKGRWKQGPGLDCDAEPGLVLQHSLLEDAL